MSNDFINDFDINIVCLDLNSPLFLNEYFKILINDYTEYKIEFIENEMPTLTIKDCIFKVKVLIIYFKLKYVK